MEQTNKITIFQMTLFIATAVGLKNHVIVIPSLLRTGGRDAWIGVLVVALLTLAWAFLLLYIYRGLKGQHINDWLKAHVNQTVSLLFRFTVGFYVVVLICVTLRETITWTSVSYLLKTPPLALILLFLIPCVLAAMTSIRTLAIANFFLLFLVTIFGFFVATANIQFKNYYLLLPLFEHGVTPIIKSAIYQASGMVELIILIIFQHQIHSELRFRHLAINTFILTGLTLGPLIGAIIEFGPVEAQLQRFPAYEEWTLVRVGKYVEHVDYLSIYQWLSGAFVRVTLYLYTLRVLLNRSSMKVNMWLLVSVSVVIVFVVIMPIDDKHFFYFLNNIALPTTFYFFFSLSVLLGLFVWRARRRENKGGNFGAKGQQSNS